MRVAFLLATGAALAAYPVWAEDSGVVVEAGVALEPAISGKSLFDLDRDRSDGGEYSVYFKVKSAPIKWGQRFYAKVGSIYSPALFQKRPLGVAVDDPTSSGYFEVGFGNEWHNFSGLSEAKCRNPEAYRVARVRPYSSFKHTKTLKGLFGNSLSHSNLATAGVRIADAEDCLAKSQTGHGAKLKKYLNYDVRAEINRDWTSDNQDENTTWTVRSDFQTMDVKGIHLVARARGDRIVYENARPTGALRRDWRWRLGGGFGTVLPESIGKPEFGIEMRHEWLRSSEPLKDGKKTQLSASLEWTFN